MLANQSDFMAYAGAFKANYRKGVHRLETILSNPTHAAEFAANLGGVSVVLGVPINLPDRNSDKLLELLLGSDVADDAVETWLHQFYEFTGWDDLLSDSARCKEMANNPLIWRAAGGSKLAVGKSIATLAGLSCSAYKDIDAVVASSTAMTAIQKSPTALNAIAASSMATAKYAAGAAGLNPADYADMKAVAASSTAMAAIIANATALNAVVTSSTAMAAVAASSTAMAAVAASSTAMTAIANAWNVTESAIAGSTVALNALKNSGKCQNVTKDIRGAVTASFVSGLCFVFTAEITVSGGRCYIKAARPTGSNELTLCDAVKSVTVNKFCKNPYVQCTDSSHTYEKNKLYFYKIG